MEGEYALTLIQSLKHLAAQDSQCRKKQLLIACFISGQLHLPPEQRARGSQGGRAPGQGQSLADLSQRQPRVLQHSQLAGRRRKHFGCLP